MRKRLSIEEQVEAQEEVEGVGLTTVVQMKIDIFNKTC